jgi:hypothetical protein
MLSILNSLSAEHSGFSGLGVSALAFGTQVRGFKTGRSRRIFQGEKILSAPSFGSEVKPWVPCRWFTTCKRSLDVSWKSASRQNSSAICRLHSSGFGYQDRSRDVDARDDWRWKLERLKQGKYNKPHWLRYIRGHYLPGPTEKKKKKKCRTWTRPVQDSMAVFSSTGEIYVKHVVVMNNINMDI